MTILLQSIKNSIILIKIDKEKVKHDKISENLLQKAHSILKRLHLAQAVNKKYFCWFTLRWNPSELASCKYVEIKRQNEVHWT